MSSRRYTPKHSSYTPKHRQARSVVLAHSAPVKVVRTTALLGSVAAAATGIAVSNGVWSGAVQTTSQGTTRAAASHLGTSAKQLTREALADRAPIVSRSDSRDRTDATKATSLSADSGPGESHEENIAAADPRTIARALLGDFGFSQDQFSCLDSLYMSESGWRVDADNPSSSAYGIPQALPGSKMASAGADWATNPETQIRWGLGYIRDSYGSPCGAWSFKASHGWY
jgi:hypothetical protein